MFGIGGAWPVGLGDQDPARFQVSTMDLVFLQISLSGSAFLSAGASLTRRGS